jgi:hypothetical protein
LKKPWQVASGSAEIKPVGKETQESRRNRKRGLAFSILIDQWNKVRIVDGWISWQG